MTSPTASEMGKLSAKAQAKDPEKLRQDRAKAGRAGAAVRWANHTPKKDKTGK